MAPLLPATPAIAPAAVPGGGSSAAETCKVALADVMAAKREDGVERSDSFDASELGELG
jgi:hypothetical protein